MLASTQMQLIAFPSFAYQLEPERWRVQVSGVVRQPYSPTIRKRVILRILGNVMGVPEEEILSEKYFPRIMPFVSDGAKNRSVAVELGSQTIRLRKRTKSNGHFSQFVSLPNEFVQSHAVKLPCGRSVLDLRLNSDGADLESNVSRVYLMPQTGVSIISDIDDTIKDSEINDRKELLANTFLRSFRSIAGMAEIYQQFREHGTDFHYVSSSPWQLLPPINEMFERDRFPNGSIHLRYFRLRNHMLQRMVRIKRSGKITVLRQLISTMHGRRFLLVGDSGEKDLEIYRSLTKSFRGQIAGVCIRSLSGKPLSSERAEKFQNRFPSVPFLVFSEPEELRRFALPLIRNCMTQ